MKYQRTIVAAMFGVFCLSGAAIAAEPDEKETATQQEACCFENPRYTGTCQVTPGPEETCGDILAYLNNPNSVGKTYCGNTKVRGGWTQVVCKGSASSVDTTCDGKRD
jgi:hypothetical protein